MGFYEKDLTELSPILGRQYTDPTFLMRIFNSLTGGPYMSFGIERYPLRHIQSVEAAEDIIISMAERVKDSPNTPQALPFLIRRHGAYVAKNSRRGFGNNVLMNEKFYSTIEEKLGSAKILPQIGRWKGHGKLCKFDTTGTISIWTNDCIPDNTFVIYYKSPSNNFDVPGAIVKNDQNISYAIPNENDPNLHFCAKMSSYIRYVEVI